MRTATILVVDDETAVRRLTKWMLESEGYHVYTAENAKEAIAITQELQCGLNLLLTDMRMPAVDGHDLILEIRRICPHIDSMLMTGALASGDVRPKNYAIIWKPFTKDQLLAAVTQILATQL